MPDAAPLQLKADSDALFYRRLERNLTALKDLLQFCIVHERLTENSVLSFDDLLGTSLTSLCVVFTANSFRQNRRKISKFARQGPLTTGGIR